jgi:hypothetical protein
MKDQEFDELCNLAKEITGLDIRYTKSRKKELIQIKCAIVNVMRRYCSASTVQLGRLFNIHHTTVIHHSKDHWSRYRYEDDYSLLYDKMVRHVMDKSEVISVEKMVNLMKTSLAV